MGNGIRSKLGAVAVLALVVGSVAVVGTAPAGATSVGDESSLRTAFANAAETSVVLTADVTLTNCGTGAVNRASGTPVTLEGQGFTITQTCPDAAVLELAGGGGLTLVGATLAGGGSGVAADGPIVVQASRITGQTSAASSAFGIVSSAGSVTLTDTAIDGVTALGTPVGAAAMAGTLTATRVSVTGLSSGDEGSGSAAVGLYAVSLTVTDSLIADLEGMSSTGLWTSDGAVVMTRTTIRNLLGREQLTPGISAAGAVTVTDSSITDVSGTIGFGIYSTAADPVTVTVTRSTIARIDGDTLLGYGIYSSSTSVQVVNSTISTVRGPAVFTSGDATLVYSTVSDSGTNSDSADPEARAQLSVANGLTMFGSVVVQHRDGASNCLAGSTASAGYNFADDSSCGLTATGDRQGAGFDALLDALSDNGGRGPTRLPRAGSPLLDAIPIAACQTGPAVGITTDERSLPRPAFSGCDIGAVEVQPVPEPVQPRFTG